MALFYQLDAQILYFTTLITSLLHVSSTTVLILRRSYFIITASGLVTLFRCLFSTQVQQGVLAEPVY